MLNYTQHLARIAYLSGIPDEQADGNEPERIRMHELALQDMGFTPADVYRGLYEVGKLSALNELDVLRMDIVSVDLRIAA